MSLLVWLPLNGDLRNNGLAGGITVTNSGATVNAAGKIGKCYEFGTAASGISLSVDDLQSCSEVSVSFWIKIISWNTAWATFFQAGKNSHAWTDYVFGFLRNSSLPRIAFVIGNGSSTTTTYCSTGDLELNRWYYIVGTYSSGKLHLYVDGDQVSEYSTALQLNSSVITKATLGRANSTVYQSNCLMNDFRIYDHALSDREVKELVKGLVAHWKLDDFIGNENLSISTPKYLNHNAYNAYQFSLTENLVAGNKYTIQLWDVDVSHSEKTESQLGVSVYWGGGSISLCTWRGTGYFVNGHADHLIMTFTAPESTHSTTANAWLNIYNSTGYVAGTMNMKIGRWKLEKGSTPTPWLPAKTDDMYSDWEFNVAHDSSGYGHEGTLSPTPPTFDQDSARYSGCMKFSSNYIHCGLSSLYPTDEITVAWWGYMDSWSSYGRAISCTESGGWNFEPSSGKIRFVVYKSAYGYGHALSETTLSSMASGWHFFVGTFDGYVAKIYVDGEYENVSTDASPEVKAAIKYQGNVPIYIGCEANGANPSSPYFNGKLSDIRIYATALSADDIKELYTASASIDNRHNVYARELVED